MDQTSETVTHNMSFKLNLTERFDCERVCGKRETVESGRDWGG